MTVRLAFTIVYAALVLVIGGPVLNPATRVGDRVDRYIVATMIVFGVSPLVLYPWAPPWYGLAAGFTVGLLGVGYLWRGRRSGGGVDDRLRDSDDAPR